jgi:hypothetical protein
MLLLDCDKFWSALLKGSLISNDMFQTMLSLDASDGKHFYGYGV